MPAGAESIGHHKLRAQKVAKGKVQLLETGSITVMCVKRHGSANWRRFGIVQRPPSPNWRVMVRDCERWNMLPLETPRVRYIAPGDERRSGCSIY